MSIERRAIREIGSGEGRHRNSMWIALPLEELIKIGIFEKPQQDAHATKR